ncbi:hypothetical protein K3728_09900 [Rhodobacteraceae bacterium M385]|nr:hypothetical protein K3728_09900 [Rhodobacteraceae bacterium M385]
MQTYDVILSPSPTATHPPFVTMRAPAGLYELTAVRGGTDDYMAWTPGHKGTWQTGISVMSDGFSDTSSTVLQAHSAQWPTPEQAVQNPASVCFELDRWRILTFFINDSYRDNSGGVTIQVSYDARPPSA